MSATRTHKAPKTDSIVASIQSRARTIADASSGAYHSALDQSKQASRQVNKYVKGNPWYAVGIAAGAGLLVGLMLRRRS